MAAEFKYTIAELEAGVSPSVKTVGGTLTVTVQSVTNITAGTLTFTFRQERSEIQETPGINTIDLAAPESIGLINTAIGGFQCTLTGFAGTATDIVIVVNDRD